MIEKIKKSLLKKKENMLVHQFSSQKMRDNDYNLFTKYDNEYTIREDRSKSTMFIFLCEKTINSNSPSNNIYI